MQIDKNLAVVVGGPEEDDEPETDLNHLNKQNRIATNIWLNATTLRLAWKDTSGTTTRNLRYWRPYEQTN